MHSFDHEKLDVYQASIAFVAGAALEGPLSGCRLSAAKHLDEACQSIPNNPECVQQGKAMLARIVAMLCKLVEQLLGHGCSTTSTSTSKSTSRTRTEDHAW